MTSTILWFGGHRVVWLALAPVRTGAGAATEIVCAALAVLPWPSSAVTVTVFAPIFAQVKAFFESVMVAAPQLSDLEATTSDSAMLAFP